MNRYAKAIAAFFAALNLWGVTATADGHVTSVEWFGLTGVALAVAAVWGVPNEDGRKRDARGRFTTT